MSGYKEDIRGRADLGRELRDAEVRLVHLEARQARLPRAVAQHAVKVKRPNSRHEFLTQSGVAALRILFFG